MPRAQWAEADDGLSPLDVATQVAVPEFDGRIITVPFSFKEIDDDGLSRVRRRPRARRAGRRARRVAHARLRHMPPAQRQGRAGALGLPDQARPDRQRGRAGHPGQRGRAAARHARRGYDIGPLTGAGALPGVEPADGDALIHALIDGRRPGPGLAHRASSWPTRSAHPGRAATASGSPRCPPSCASRDRAGWGPPPGELFVDRSPATRRRDRARRAASGQRACCWSSRRAASARTRWRSTTTRTCRPATTTWPPTAGWSEEFGAHAVVHLGKHGNLEWLPGKTLGMSAACGGRRRARQPAADLPVPGQRPRRGHAGQAPRARHDRRPPGPADGPRRDLRRHRPAGAAARRARQHRRARPGQAARDPGADLDADPGRAAGPRPRPGRTARTTTSSTTSCCTSTAGCARSRTSRSATACTCSAAAPTGAARVDLVLAILRARQLWGGAGSAARPARGARPRRGRHGQPRRGRRGRGSGPGAGRGAWRRPAGGRTRPRR